MAMLTFCHDLFFFIEGATFTTAPSWLNISKNMAVFPACHPVFPRSHPNFQFARLSGLPFRGFNYPEREVPDLFLQSPYWALHLFKTRNLPSSRFFAIFGAVFILNTVQR
jgi:hypothetical protein